MRAVFGAFGGLPGIIEKDPEVWIEKDGKLVNSCVLPEMKDALSLLAKWYADVVIDPEFITSEIKADVMILPMHSIQAG
jgi:putative aldouronate transport system substrate-binding protein